MHTDADAGFVAPTDYELIRVAGPDALDFLQALTSNDLSMMAEPGHTRLTAFCSPQGRLLGLMRVSGHGQTLHARVPRGMCEALLPRFRRFVLRSRVEFAGPLEGVTVMGAAGCGVAGMLQAAGLPAPPPGASGSAGDVTVLGVGESRFELLLPDLRRGPVLDSLQSAGAARRNGDAWKQAEIQARVPEIYPATMDLFIPQMLGLDALGAVDFHKGCYPGQEIIARIHYKGSIKRHMHVASCTGNAAVTPGVPVMAADGPAAGTVVRAAAAGAEEQLLLVVLADADAGGPLTLETGEPVRLGAPVAEG